jgi:hypothetical protein
VYTLQKSSDLITFRLTNILLYTLLDHNLSSWDENTRKHLLLSLNSSLYLKTVNNVRSIYVRSYYMCTKLGSWCEQCRKIVTMFFGSKPITLRLSYRGRMLFCVTIPPSFSHVPNRSLHKYLTTVVRNTVGTLSCFISKFFLRKLCYLYVTYRETLRAPIKIFCCFNVHIFQTEAVFVTLLWGLKLACVGNTNLFP